MVLDRLVSDNMVRHIKYIVQMKSKVLLHKDINFNIS